MKKGVEFWTEWRHLGGKETVPVLCIAKSRGKLTINEIREICEWNELNFWYLCIDARGESDEQFGDEPQEGDFVMCINGDYAVFLTESERERRLKG